MSSTQDKPVIPVILCGGSGTRLWPLSRKSFPKQFARLMGEKSLFQHTAKRLDTPNFAAPLIMTSDQYRFIAIEQLAAMGIAPQAVVIEPMPRGTAPAILAAALWQAERDPEATMLICPADHFIPEADGFNNAVNLARETAAKGDLVTFGVVPDRPETGYGYLELPEGSAVNGHEPCALASFVEKPDIETAQSMLERGNFLWNAGIFAFTAATLIDACKALAPEVYEATQRAFSAMKSDLSFLRLEQDAWQDSPDISIDYAIMEKADNISVVPLDTRWSDLGTWEAVWRDGAKDQDGNLVSENALSIKCHNSMLRCDSNNIALVGIGLDDIMVTAMNDAVLVAHRSQSQAIKDAVAKLKAGGVKQAEAFPVEHRPWGKFESLVLDDRFQVKRITVSPGGKLSLQSHFHRAEHWIVVGGTARVTVDETVSMIGENQSIYVPLGAKHRLENSGKVPVTLIEVQTGSYLGEDDIVRYDDVYARS